MTRWLGRVAAAMLLWVAVAPVAGAEQSMSLGRLSPSLERIDQRSIHLTHDELYKIRTVAERANARLKDEFGAQNLRVRGHAKAFCHLMFGVAALAADALVRLFNSRPCPLLA